MVPSLDGDGEGVVTLDDGDSFPRERERTGRLMPGLDFCLLLQNHTLTSSGSRSSCWEISSMAWRFGLGFCKKNVSKVDFV